MIVGPLKILDGQVFLMESVDFIRLLNNRKTFYEFVYIDSM